MKISIDEYISMQQDGQVLNEAFKAGNQARKKESVRDTVEETNPLVDTLLNEINTEDLVRRYLEKNRFMTVHATFRDIILHVLGRLTNVERGVLNHCLQVYTYQQSGGEFGVIHFRTMGSFKTKLDDDRLVFEIKEDEPAKMVADFFERVSGGGSLLLHIDTHEARLGESYVTAAGIGFCLKIVEMFNRFREGTDIYEAFKTGNRARKKESVRDTVDSVNIIDPETADHLLTGAIQEVNRWGYHDLFKVGSRLYITEFVRSLFGYATGSSAPGEYLQISSMELDDEGMSGDMWIKYWGTKQDTVYTAYSRRWMVSWHLEPDGSFIGFRLADFKDSTEDSWSTPLLIVYADGSFETGPGFMSFVNDFMTESAKMYKAGMLVPQHPVNEAFRAGNRARKKESAQDSVESVDNIQAQIDLFKEQTGIELELRDGRPYFGNKLFLAGCTELTSLPDGLIVDHNLSLKNCTGLTSLPVGLTVRGYLDLKYCTGLTCLPDGLRVGGHLDLSGCTGLTSLPKGLTAKGLWLTDCTNLTSLPDSLTVEGILNLRGCTGLTSLPHEITVESWMDLTGCTGLTSLPDGMTVKDSLYLRDCTGLTSLPQGLTVGGRLDLRGCTGLTSLPKDLKVGRDIIGFTNEAFKAGNRARKKEAVADTVQTVESTITCEEAAKTLCRFLLEPVRAPWDPRETMSRGNVDDEEVNDALGYALPDTENDHYNFEIELCYASCGRGFDFDSDSKITINIYETRQDRYDKTSPVLKKVSIGSTGVGSDNGTFDLLKQGRSDDDVYGNPVDLTPGTFASLMELCAILFPLHGNDSKLSYFIGGGNGAERVQTYGQFLYANQELLWPWLNQDDRELVYEIENEMHKEYVEEAFRAGNRARKKETAQDNVTDSFNNIRAQVELFREQTGIELEIIDGRPVHFGDLNIIDNQKVTALPDNLTVKDGGLHINGCPNIRELPHGMRIDMFLDLRRSNGIKSVPYDTAFISRGFIINYNNMWEKPHNEELTKFFQKMKIWYGPDSGIRISDWKKWQMENGYGYLYDGLDEAFRAGNRARKKESVQDTVQEVGESVEEQIERFKDETGIRLKIRDGRPYTSGPLSLNGIETLTRLPNNLHVDYYCCISNCPNIEAIPHGLSTRTGALNADHCKNLRYVPNDICINNTIYFDHCPSLESLPEGLKVYNGGIDLSYCTALKSLPENFEVNGPLKVTGCENLKTLPKGLSVGYLECEHSGLTELPLDIRFTDSDTWFFLRPNIEVSVFFHKITGVMFDSNKPMLMKYTWCRWQQEHGYVDYGIDLSKPVDINEGGKAVKGVSPIRGDLALTVANKAASALMQQLPGVKIVPVGSVGKKPADQESGDIDLAVQVPWEQKDLVIQAVQKLVPDAECREFKALWLVSAPWPWREDGLYGRVQLDMFLGPDIRLTQFMRWSPNLAKGESRYKGLYRTALLISIASCIPAEGRQDVKFDGSDCLKDCWRYSLSPRTGLRIVHKTWASKTGKMLKNPKNVDEDTVIVAVDPQIIAVKLLGDGATLNDCVSLESVWKRMQSPQFPYKQYQQQILEEYYKYLQDAGEELPAMKQNEDNTDVKKD